MNRLKTIGEDGAMPLELEDLEWNDAAVRDAFYGLISAFGIHATESFKLSGCEVTITQNGSNDDYACTEGYICLNGEVFKVDACSISIGNSPYSSRVIFDTNISLTNAETFEDLTVHQCYEVRKATLKTANLVIPFPYMTYDAPTLITVIKNKINELGIDWKLVGAIGNPAFAAGWSNVGAPYPVAGYRIDGFGKVELKGLVSNNTPTGNIFTLPVGYRPVFDQYFICVYGDTVAHVDVKTDGSVHASATNATTPIDLSRISFRTT